MFSLESFYSVLYSNLLRPANFYYKYFYPFGSTDKSNLTDFSNVYCELFHTPPPPYIASHMCIAYDQEPMIPFSLTDRYWDKRTPKYCMLFANSERSQFKNEFLRNNGYLNWYYFFHGFAALDWYRNYSYLNIEKNYDNTFMCLNRLWQDDRSYRLTLISSLKERNLLNKGIVSLHSDNFENILNETTKSDTKLTDRAKNKILKLLELEKLPLLADQMNILGSASASGSINDLIFNKSALWHVVSETIFYYDKRHLTEKIFKPIVSKRPFILVGATNNLAYLKDYGFQTFDKWIDESYDTITDNDDRIDAIVEQLSVLCSMDKAAERRMYLEMQEVLDYNYNHFYNGSFRYKISKELIDNFKGCCVAWNQNMCREPDMIPIWNIDFDKALATLIQ